MNAFESIVARILSSEGFWTRTNYKVELSKEQKVKIGRPSSPRWDLDVVAYQPGPNVLWVVECKSYLDSFGVAFRGFDPATGGTERFKLFNEETLRQVIFDQLVRQLGQEKLVHGSPEVKLCLAAPNIQKNSRDQLRSHFESNGWGLFEREWIVERLHGIAADGYDDSIVSIMAKLFSATNP